MTDRYLRATSSDVRERRPYRTPALIQYGSVTKLTQSGSSTSPEGTVPAKAMMCL